MRGALQVEVLTQSDDTALIVWTMRNGDAIELRAPSTYAAVYALSDQLISGYGRSSGASGSLAGARQQALVNGVVVAGRKQTEAVLRAYRPWTADDDRVHMNLVAVLTQAWLDALPDEPEIARRAMDGIDGLLKKGAEPRGKPSLYEAAMELLSEAIGGYGVEAIRSQESNAGPYYGDIVATYVNAGDTYDSTVIFNAETDTFERMSVGDWIERYEAEGGTVI